MDYSGVSSTSASGITLTLGVPLIAPGTTSAGADTLGGFENVIGSDFGDSITGDAGPNTIDGGAGDDPVLDGGAGTDTLSYASAPGAVTVDLGQPGAAEHRRRYRHDRHEQLREPDRLGVLRLAQR